MSEVWEGEVDGLRRKMKVLLSRWEHNEWRIYGECFKCGEFLEWAEKSPTCFTIAIRKIKEDDPKSEFGYSLVDVSKPYIMGFVGVKWQRWGHTTETTSACSGYGNFSAEVLEIDGDQGKETTFLNGDPGYGEGI